MFALNEKVVYPGHGVAKISCIVEKLVGGSTAKFFELIFYNKNMTILVPICSLESVGIRKLSSVEKINSALKILSEPSKVGCDNNSINWNKRNKEYQLKLGSGSIDEMCKIYRDLKIISSKKELSFGEKNLLSRTELLLSEEIAFASNVEEAKTVEKLRSLFMC